MNKSVGAAVAAFEKSAAIYPFAIARRYTLFRIDGVILEVSRPVFDFLHTLRGLPVATRVQTLEREHGRETAAKVLEAVAELGRSGVLEGEPQWVRAPDAERAAPAGVVLMLTQTCNLACHYCYGGGGTYGGGRKWMTFAMARRAVDLMVARAPERKKFRIFFFGGEPLLNIRLLKQVVAYCDRRSHDRGIEFAYSITTNGTLVNDAIVDYFREHRFDVMVSYDGTGQFQRPYATGRPTDEVVLRTMQRLADAGISFQIRATMTRQTANADTFCSLESVGKLLRREVVISPVSDAKHTAVENDRRLTLRQRDRDRMERLQRNVAHANYAAAVSGRRPESIADGNKQLVRALLRGEIRGLGECGACFSMAAVSTDGRIYPCHRFVGMDDYAIGSVADGVDAAKVRAFYSTAAAVAQTSCGDCAARQICGGACFYINADGHGGFNPPDPRDCERLRGRLQHAVGTALRLRELDTESGRRFTGEV